MRGHDVSTPFIYIIPIVFVCMLCSVLGVVLTHASIDTQGDILTGLSACVALEGSADKFFAAVVRPSARRTTQLRMIGFGIPAGCLVDFLLVLIQVPIFSGK